MIQRVVPGYGLSHATAPVESVMVRPAIDASGNEFGCDCSTSMGPAALERRQRLHGLIKFVFIEQRSVWAGAVIGAVLLRVCYSRGD